MAVSFTKQLNLKFRFMTGERDNFAAKSKNFGLEMQCGPGSAEKVKSLRAHVAQLEETSKRKGPKARTK